MDESLAALQIKSQRLALTAIRSDLQTAGIATPFIDGQIAAMTAVLESIDQGEDLAPERSN